MDIDADTTVQMAVQSISRLRRVPCGKTRRRLYLDIVAELCSWVEESVIEARMERNEVKKYANLNVAGLKIGAASSRPGLR